MSIAGEMTIYTAAAVGKQVMAGLTDRSNTEVLDLTKVSEIDTAGLQILLIARRHTQARGRELQITSPGPGVRAMMDLLQLSSLIEDNAKEGRS